MDNKLSELSKPVAWIIGEESIEEFKRGYETFVVRGDDVDSTEETMKLYSQEYVSALLSQTEADRNIKARLCSESNRLHDGIKAAEKRIAELEKQLHNEGAANVHAYERIRGLEKRLATPVRLPEGLAQKIKVTGYYEALNEMMNCIRAAGFKV